MPFEFTDDFQPNIPGRLLSVLQLQWNCHLLEDKYLNCASSCRKTVQTLTHFKRKKPVSNWTPCTNINSEHLNVCKLGVWRQPKKESGLCSVSCTDTLEPTPAYKIWLEGDTEWLYSTDAQCVLIQYLPFPLEEMLMHMYSCFP